MASATSFSKATDRRLGGQMAPGISGGMLSYEDLQAQLDAERSWWSTSIQTIQMQQVQALEDMINEKVGKSVEMTCALSASCDERFGQIEAQAAERAAQVNNIRLELTSLGGSGRSTNELGAMDKREVTSELNALQSDIEAMWIQHRAALSGISSTKEQQQHLEASFGDLRKDLEGALTDVRAQHSSFSGLAADWEQLQSQVRTIEATVTTVRGEVSKAQVAGSASPQKFDAQRNEHRDEFGHEVSMLRQELEVLSGYGDCLHRLQERAESMEELQRRQEEVHQHLEVVRTEQREELAHEILAVRQEIEARGSDPQLASEVSALRQELGVRLQAVALAPAAPAAQAPAPASLAPAESPATAERLRQLEAEMQGARDDLEAEVMHRCVNVSDLHARLAREIADMGRRVEAHWGEISNALERRAHV